MLTNIAVISEVFVFGASYQTLMKQKQQWNIKTTITKRASITATDTLFAFISQISSGNTCDRLYI